MATLSKAKLNKAKQNKQLYLQGKPFLLPRRLDIHRKAMKAYLDKGETQVKDPKRVFTTECSWIGGDNCTANATGRIWLYLSKSFLNQTIHVKVAFHELDFDIEVDTYGYVFKTVNGEKVKVTYDSKF